jgi:hypothetical protein
LLNLEENMIKVILHNGLIFLRMMNLKIELQRIVIVLEFFVLMMLKKLVKHTTKIKLLKICAVCLFERSKEFSVSGFKFSIFENRVDYKEFSV